LSQSSTRPITSFIVFGSTATDPAVPLGTYTETVLDNLGISESDLNIVSKEQDAKSVLAKITLGEADADVVLLPADMTAALAAAGVADDGTKVAIGSVRIGAAVHADAPVPDVSTVAALRNALLAADAVLLTRAPTGDPLMQAIARVGVAEAIAYMPAPYPTRCRSCSPMGRPC